MKPQRPGVRRIVVEGTRAMLASPGVFLLGAALYALINYAIVPGANRVWQAAFGVTDVYSLPGACAMMVIVFALTVPLFYGLHVAALRQMRNGRASATDLLEGAKHFDCAILGGLAWVFAFAVCMCVVGLLAAVIWMLAFAADLPVRDLQPRHAPYVALVFVPALEVLLVPLAGLVMPALADGVRLRGFKGLCPPRSPRHFWPLAGVGVAGAVALALLAKVPGVTSLATPWFACMMTRAYLDIESERRWRAWANGELSDSTA